MEIRLSLDNPADYAKFLRIKSLPQYRFQGRTAIVPDEYAARLGFDDPTVESGHYEPIAGLFDYQRDITALAIRKRKFAIFAQCGLGKTMCILEYVRHVERRLPKGRAILIISPLMVVEQTLEETAKWYGDSLPIEHVRAAKLDQWLTSGTSRIGITNYDALHDETPQGRLGALVLDESSALKGHYGKWAQDCLRLGRGLDWKLACTGTPAPNDRIEFANHAVFMDAFRTVNAFLARYFVNKGQTQERWVLKPHALAPFYKSLSHWCIFLENPSTYGWKDNANNIPPIHVHVHDVEMHDTQHAAVRDLTGMLFSNDPGGIGSRSKLARIAKSGDSLKPAFIRELIDSWPDESTIVWCMFNDEQERLEREISGAASIMGSTPYEDRLQIINKFKAGETRVLITKPSVLGYGLNLQVATRQVFSSCHDSFESFHQAVKRSNRVGSTRPLNVHLPVTDVERPMMENVLRKAHRVQMDIEEQERIFKNVAL